MKKLLTFAAAIAAAGMMAAPANADTLDFGAEAQFNGERGIASGGILGPTLYIDRAVRLVTYGGDYFAYLDGPGGGQPTAGLGVCKDVSATAQCVPSSDDNVTFGEGVGIEFLRTAFDVRRINFLTEGHVDFNSNDSNTLLIGLNGSLAVTRYTFQDAYQAAIAGAFLNLNSIEFYFDGPFFASIRRIIDNGLRANPDQFYIGSISDVPIPGALPLLLSGIAGLGFASRRKKKTA